MITRAILLSLYVVVGAIIGVYAVDKHGKQAPLVHFFMIVAGWPVVIVQTIVRCSR